MSLYQDQFGSLEPDYITVDFRYGLLTLSLAPQATQLLSTVNEPVLMQHGINLIVQYDDSLILHATTEDLAIIDCMSILEIDESYKPSQTADRDIRHASMFQFKTNLVTDQHQSVEGEYRSLDLVFQLKEPENLQVTEYNDICVSSATENFNVECLIDSDALPSIDLNGSF